MSSFRMGRTLVGIVVLAVGALSSGCGDTNEGRSVRSAADSMASGDLTVVVHMTGLLLVVPSSQGGATVMLPDTRKVGAHIGWLGFGFSSFTSDLNRLCNRKKSYIKAEICYVDLYKWELREFGAGGETASPPTPLPPTLLNVAMVAGGKHKAWLANGAAPRRVVFGSGGPGRTCSLASWTHEVVNEAGQVVATKTGPLANVLEWKIRNPTVRELEFRHRTNGSTIRVLLPQAGEVHMVLAHVRPPEVADLPPSKPRTPSSRLPKSAPHFDAYYDLLFSRPSQAAKIPEGDSRRRFPHDAKDPLSRACEVSITRPGKREAESRAIGTVACMVATADPL